jgi:hypothetical protein
VRDDDVDELRQQLAHYRQKAVQLDVLVFEMRALLQSGKGFSEIMNIVPLLTAFMAVCRKWEVLATVIGEVTYTEEGEFELTSLEPER